MSTNDRVPVEGVQGFSSEGQMVDSGGPPSDDGLDEFRSESEEPSELLHSAPTPRPMLQQTATGGASAAPHVHRSSHHGFAIATSAVAIVLAVAVAGVLLRTRGAGEQTASAPSAEVVPGGALPKTESQQTPRVPAASPSAPEAARGVARQVPTTVEPPARKSVTSARPSRASVSRQSRPPARSRAAGTTPRLDTRFRSSSISAPASAPVAPAAPVPQPIPTGTPEETERPIALAVREPAPAEIGAQVSVTTNSATDELTFRWSAPVGRFADPTAPQTRFFCPETPQSVPVTVTVTDGNAASASDTFMIQCVPPK